ncbi:hypothetical protein DSECCO2_462110 [anaerobic digester metagenome]
MSMLPKPRYWLLFAPLLRWPMTTTAQPVFSATALMRLSTGRISFARCISTSAPIYACSGSRIKSFAPVSVMACSIRMSESDNSFSLSSMTITRSQSAPDWTRRGFTVSPKPSSAVWKITLIGGAAVLLSGRAVAVVRAAAIASTTVVLPSPGSP